MDHHPSPDRIQAATTFLDVLTAHTKLQLARDDATLKLKRVQKEYDENRKYFEYPGIREQKTQARDRAQDKLKLIEQQIQQNAPQRENVLLKTLAEVVHRADEEVTRRETHRNDMSQLEKKLLDLERQLKVLQSDVTSKLFTQANEALLRVDALQTKLGEMEDAHRRDFKSKIDGLKEESTTRLNRLEEASQSASQADQETRSKVETFANECNARLDKLEEAGQAAPPELEGIGSRIDTLANAFSSRLEKLEENVARASAELEETTEKIQSLEGEVREREPLIIEYIQGVEQKVSKLEGEDRPTQDDVSSATDSSTLRRLQKAEAQISKLQTQCEECHQSRIDQTTQIHGCLDRVRKLETTRSSHPTPIAAAAPLPPPIPAPQQLLGFQPALVNGLASHDDDPPPTPSQRTTQEIEALKAHVANLTQRMDNLTTDDIVKQMVDNMNVMFPDAKNFQHSLRSLRAECSQAWSRAHQAHQQLSAATTPLIQQLRVELDALTQQLRVEVDALTRRLDATCHLIDATHLRVAQHDRAARDGDAHFARLDADVAHLNGSVAELQESSAVLHTAVHRIQEAPRGELKDGGGGDERVGG
jgi:chromosome segregation ATPase